MLEDDPSLMIDAARLLLLAGSGLVAGVLGAMLGIGGGVILVPVLILGFQIPIHEAVAASLVAVVATSTAAGSVYVGEGLTNMRLAMTLEIATTSGAIAGGLTAAILPERDLLLIFATLLIVTAALLGFGGEAGEREPPAPRGQASLGYEEPGALAGAFRSPRTGELVRYRARRLPVGLAVSFLAGNVSGLLGVGGGFLKVPAMRLGMEVPTRVAAATSNFMIGVTAAASAVIYLGRGFLVPLLAAPVALGVVAGALAGTRLSARVSGLALARVLAVLLLAVAVQMVLRALGGVHG
jgi:uncharacterized membrane protein YfcA